MNTLPRRRTWTAAFAAAIACAGGAPAGAQTFASENGPIVVTTVADGLEHPFGLAFLPDGRMLVSERPGRLRLVSRQGALAAPLGNVPEVFAVGQAGLLDVILDRDFAANATIYLCYSRERGGNAAVARARLTDTALADVAIIFRQIGPGGTHNHGCRIAQAADRTLFVTLGDHFGPRDEAQNLAVHNGKIVRFAPDGTVPADNPFVGRPDARPEIFALGVRNPQGLTFHPRTGRLFEQEHGPRGGDEVNIIEAGRNYGWPVIGYGIDYNGARIHEGTHKDGMAQPLWHWVPSIAPSGMTFYSGTLFPAWKDNLFVGALRSAMLVRLTLEGERIVAEERLLTTLGERIRDVREGRDGALYLLTDNAKGRILRLTPR